MTRVIEERASAKVNLWLEVLRKRADGYHELETLMHEIDLHDLVVVSERASGVELRVEGADDIEVDENNLALKALRALEGRVGRELPCTIRLVKRIPAGGGLGGGSSDAGAVLRALDRLHELGLEAAALEETAATFGSDTAFFVRGGTAMCRGRGEIIESLPAPGRLTFLLVLPGLHVPTPGVFKALELTGASREPYHLLTALRSRDPAMIRAQLFNRLEAPAMKVHPELGRILKILAPQGFLLSGSGSTIFRLCDDADQASALGDRLRADLGLETRVAFSAAG